jgi:Ca-activated chloride channel family protein
MSFAFQSKIFLWGLLGLLLLMAFYYSWKKHFQNRIERLGSSWTHFQTDFQQQGRRFGGQALLLWLAMGLLIVSMAGPQGRVIEQETQGSGTDILIALDVSKSMLAQDVSPNRLERAKRKVTDLLGKLSNDRVALVVFAGAPFLQAPLTMDHSAIIEHLSYIDTDWIPVPGSNLSLVFDLSKKVFERARSAKKVILFLTDGEDLESKVLMQAQDLSKNGIEVHVLGVGTGQGAPIPSETGDFLKNADGTTVISKLDIETMEKLAGFGKGVFVESTPHDADLNAILSRWTGTKGNQTSKSKSLRREELFQWLSIPCLFLLLFVYFLNGEVSLFKRRENGVFIWILIGVGSLGIWPRSFAQPGLDQSAAKWEGYQGQRKYNDDRFEEASQHLERAVVEDPKSVELKYNLGNAYYKMGNFDKAAEVWNQAILEGSKVANQSEKNAKETKDTSTVTKERLLPYLHYNLGNAHFRAQKFDKAVEAYKKALELNPNDKEAEYNLKLAQEKLKEQNQQQKDKPKDQDKKEQDKKDSSPDQNQSDSPSHPTPQPTQGSTPSPQPSPGAAQTPNPSPPSPGPETGDPKKAPTPLSREKKDAMNLLNQVESSQKDALKKKIQKKLKDFQGNESGQTW